MRVRQLPRIMEQFNHPQQATDVARLRRVCKHAAAWCTKRLASTYTSFCCSDGLLVGSGTTCLGTMRTPELSLSFIA